MLVKKICVYLCRSAVDDGYKNCIINQLFCNLNGHWMATEQYAKFLYLLTGIGYE